MRAAFTTCNVLACSFERAILGCPIIMLEFMRLSLGVLLLSTTGSSTPAIHAQYFEETASVAACKPLT
jgi:hypothetical protein